MCCFHHRESTLNAKVEEIIALADSVCSCVDRAGDHPRKGTETSPLLPFLSRPFAPRQTEEDQTMRFSSASFFLSVDVTSLMMSLVAHLLFSSFLLCNDENRPLVLEKGDFNERAVRAHGFLVVNYAMARDTPLLAVTLFRSDEMR